MRYVILIAVALLTVLFGALALQSDLWLAPLAVMLTLTGIGFHDLFQTKHSIRRIYPVVITVTAADGAVRLSDEQAGQVAELVVEARKRKPGG